MMQLPQFKNSDKLYHFLGGLGIAALLHYLGESSTHVFYAVALIAALKEGYDALHPDRHTADFWDFAATLAGPCVFYLFI